jgi:hypothetical protein
MLRSQIRAGKAPTISTEMPLRVNRAFALYVVLFLVICAIEWGSAAYHTFILHSSYPYTTAFFAPVNRFGDWTDFLARVSHYGEPGMQLRNDVGHPYPYPLPSIYIFLFFIRCFHNPITSYVHATVFIFLSATLLFLFHLYKHTRANRLVLFVVWITFLFGSPAQFLLDRGNIEVFLWLFVLLGLVCYVRNWKYAAAFFFALAACMKIYPALYFLLFLPRRQYKAAAVGVLLTAGFSLAALAAVGPTVPQAFHDMSGAALWLRKNQIVALAEGILRWDHSLLAVWKQAWSGMHWMRHPGDAQYAPTFERSVAIYSVLAPLAFIATYVLRLRRMPILNQFMALTIFSVILPYVSYEYTLVHIYLVLAAFIVFLVQDQDATTNALLGPRLYVVMACFAIVCAPLAFLAFEFYQGQIKAIVLLVLLTIVLCTPMPSTLFRDRPAST